MFHTTEFQTIYCKIFLFIRLTTTNQQDTEDWMVCVTPLRSSLPKYALLYITQQLLMRVKEEKMR